MDSVRKKNILLKLSIPVIFVAVSSFGQNSKSAFEVASIKPNNSGTSLMSLGGPEMARGRFVGKNVALQTLVQFAYDVLDFQIVGGPSWMRSDRFDIEAKAEGPLTLDQARAALQLLLEERFQLKIRRESANKPVYALMIAKKGSKLKLSEDQTPPVLGGPANGVPPPPANGILRGAARSRPGEFHANARTLDSLTLLLSSQLSRPVLDRTFHKGLYDIDLKWTPDHIPAELPQELKPDPSGPSLFTALEEQLGLRLESTTAPVDVLVIETIKKPTEN